MEKKLLIVVGITFLFLGTCIAPSIAIDSVKKSSAPISNGNILYVGGTGEGNYTKIQNAIDNATDGDTVFVYNGIYYENVFVNKLIILIGEHKDHTIIDCEEIGYGITVQGDMLYIGDFSIRNCHYGCMGIIAYSSGDLQIENCNVYKNGESGIELHFDCHDIIINNCSLYNNENKGLSIHGCHDIIVNNCNIIDNELQGIGISESQNITITDCDIDNSSKNSIVAYSSQNIAINDNSISNSSIGIYLMISNNNIISRNSFFNNGLFVESSYDNNVKNNLVNGMPLIYLEDETDYVIDYEAGQIILVNCDNILAENLNLSNTSIGIELFETYDSAIKNIECSNNYYGVYILNSSDNIITGNNILNCDNGVYLNSNSCKNKIYHNNFIDNIENAYDEGKNTWNDFKYGNYWSDYKERYPNSKPKILRPWIWNISYAIPGQIDNTDNCPLVNQWPKTRTKNIQHQTIAHPILHWLFGRFPLLERLLNLVI